MRGAEPWRGARPTHHRARNYLLPHIRIAMTHPQFLIKSNIKRSGKKNFDLGAAEGISAVLFLFFSYIVPQGVY